MSIAHDTVPETLRERKKNLTRLAIHEAAVELVEKNGLDGATVEQICERADVSARTFFNYYPSKSAAALGLPDPAITEESIARFRAATGGLVPALCRLVAEPADARMDHHRMKQVIQRRPELVPAFVQWMSSVREQFVQLAAERTESHEVATAAVALVTSAFSLVLHDHSVNDAPAVERLQDAVDALIASGSARLTPVAAG